MNCAEYQLWLILHDPVGAFVGEQMTTLWQTLGNEDVLFAPLRGSGFCGQDNYRLIAQIVQLRDSPCRFGKALELARNGVTEFCLDPKNRGHLPFNRRQIPKPGTGNGSRIGRRSSTDHPHWM